MVWPFGSSDAGKEAVSNEPKKKPISWADSLGNHESDHFAAAKEWAPMIAFSLAGLGALQLYANYLRRIPGAAFVRPSFFHNRSLFGKVTSVGDGDGLNMFHTPGGRATGWGWLRSVPSTRKELKDRTVWPAPCGLVWISIDFLVRYRSVSRVSTHRKAPTSAVLHNPSRPKRGNGSPIMSSIAMCAPTSIKGITMIA